MALCYYEKMGKITINRFDKDFSIDIYTCNALAAFIYEYEEDGTTWHNLWSFFADKAHVNNIMTNCGSLFGDDVQVKNIELNLSYKEAKTLLDILTKIGGYNVTCYYNKTK